LGRVHHGIHMFVIVVSCAFALGSLSLLFAACWQGPTPATASPAPAAASATVVLGLMPPPLLTVFAPDFDFGFGARARVELVCGAQRDSVETDERAASRSRRPGISRLPALVAHQGFAPYEQDVDTSTEVTRIALRIADLSQQVNVAAEEPSHGRSVPSSCPALT